MKKLLALLIMLMAAFGCTACSDSMVGFMQVGAEISALENVQQNGEVAFSWEVSEETKADFPADLSDCKFTFKSETDNKNMKAKLSGILSLGDSDLPLTVYVDNVKVYFNAAELIALYQKFDTNTAALAELKTVLSDAEWLCVNILDDDTWAEYQKALQDGEISSGELYDEIVGMFDSVKKPFANFKSDLITKKGNTYTLSVDNQSIIAFIEDFLQYSAKNCTSIAEALCSWVDESALFDDEYKSEMKSTIYAAVSLAQGLTDTDWADLKSDLQTGAESWPFDFSCDYSLTRNSAKSFATSFAFDYKGSDEQSDMSSFKIQGKCDTVAVGSVKIDIPTAKILNVDDIKTDGLRSDSVSATIYLDENYMSYHHYYALPFLQNSDINDPNVRIINNTTYLGLRAVGEACGEEVGWDSVKKMPYVVRDNKPMYISGYTDTQLGCSYLKVRDFEKLGYVVDYSKTEITGQIVTLSR